MDISPDKQNIDKVFANTPYYIDFYQREYKWTSEPVKRLLDDIFYKFNEVYQKNRNLPPDEQIVDSKYPWYYLNTYVTNTIDGRVYIVDGQQRLTTLTLILINLYHKTSLYDSQLFGWVEDKICGRSGYGKTFWMRHESHLSTLESIFEEKVDNTNTDSGLTAENMVKNYKTIKTWIDQNIEDKNQLETFIFYFLRRLVLINLSVEQTDVPMVFEVINDRGVRLKPYEILKGKLLGQIDKILLDKHQYNQLWENKTRAINQLSDDETDRFFRFYLKARFSQNRNDAKRYDGDYHRLMFSNDFQQHLKLDHNPQGVMDFLSKDFTYFSNLYVKLSMRLKNDNKGGFAFNRLNNIDGVLLLGLSVCKINDLDEDNKINKVAHETDRLFSLMQLQNIYESNSFQESLYNIASKIRDSDTDSIRYAFDEELTKALTEKRNATTYEPLTYSLFKTAGDNLNTRFKRYFFARIDGFLSEQFKVEMRHSYEDLVTKTGAKTGFHIEHILSKNEENQKYFPDEDTFLVERNRLGGILLLKGKDNISSSNEIYQQKLKTYSGTLLWNETLREDFYKSNLDCERFKKEYDLKELIPIDKFDNEALENRHILLFKIARMIWA
ncbi:DUF262 domain-containing protein [Lonepinella sp. BR2904]|uniref:DUF262 domain-containing protein n=1 Tax=Lonepinella sp. BR2904 TaxID=3434551 RepID=UPI003F6DF655